MADNHIAGWDIGGAHNKLAFIVDGELSVYQWECSLWKGINELISSLHTASTILPSPIKCHHVTMTGELVDLFESHQQGVQVIMQTFSSVITGRCLFYSFKGLLSYQQALNEPLSVASANWIASAELVSRHQRNCIFVDIGSTTTDLVQINDNGLSINGFTDYERLVSGELVYTGVVRTCVNTICHEIPFNNNWVPLMAEMFATSADVYRILEWLPEHADYGSTMDGCEKDKLSSMRRLARMVGLDYDPENDNDWFEVSEYISGQQMQIIEKQMSRMLSINPSINTLVGAGVGTFLIELIAERLSLNYINFAQCVIPDDLKYQPSCSDCAPAIALLFMNSPIH